MPRSYFTVMKIVEIVALTTVILNVFAIPVVPSMPRIWESRARKFIIPASCISMFVASLVILFGPPLDAPGVKLCDSAVAELAAAQDQVDLDRAKFVIQQESCTLSDRLDTLPR